jgi:cell division septal protein FtsQ
MKKGRKDRKKERRKERERRRKKERKKKKEERRKERKAMHCLAVLVLSLLALCSALGLLLVPLLASLSSFCLSLSLFFLLMA